MLLLKNNCDLNVTNEHGDTPLIEAAKWNNMTVARELMVLVTSKSPAKRARPRPRWSRRRAMTPSQNAS